MNSPITTKLYFWLSILLPLSLCVGSAIVIYQDLNPVWSFTKRGIDEFVRIFNIPIKLAGLCLLLAGAAFAFYRANLSYKQTNLSLNQNIKQTYTTLRDEFIVIRSSYPYKNQLLTFQDITLFNSIYPQSKTGRYHISSRVEHYLFSSSTYDTSNFQGMFTNLTKLTRTKARFLSISYRGIIENYNKIKQILPIEHETIIPDQDGPLFVGDYAGVLLKIFEEIINIVDSLNTFENLNITQSYQNKIVPFFKEFNNSDSRDLIAKLKNISIETTEIQSCYNLIIELDFLEPLINGEIDEFDMENIQVLNALPYNRIAREFLYDMFTTSDFFTGILLNQPGKQVFRNFLELPQLKPV